MNEFDSTNERGEISKNKTATSDSIDKINEKLEVLYAQTDNDATNTEIVKLLCELAYTLYRSDPKQAEGCANQALVLAERIGFKKGIAESLLVIGTSYWVRGNYDKSLRYYNKSLKICEETGHKKGIASCYSNIGNIRKYQGDYEQALSNHIRSLKIKEEIGDKPGAAKSYNNIGIIYDELKKDAHALESYRKALRLFEELGDKQGIAFSYNNIGIIFETQGDNTRAFEYYHNSLKIKEEVGDKKGIASSYLNIGTLYNEQKEYDCALEYCLKALEIFEEIGDKRCIADSNNNIGRIYTHLEHYDSAQFYLQKGLELAQIIRTKDFETDSYKYLSELYQAQEDFEKSLAYHRKYSKLREEIFSDISSEKIAQMQVRYETEKKVKEAEIYRGIFENTLIGMYRITSERHILMANSALLSMLGYSSFDELVQHNLQDQRNDSEHPNFDFFEHIKGSEVLLGFESVWLRQDSSSLSVRLSSRVIRDESGNVLYYEGTVEDITEQKKTEMALKKQDRILSAISESANILLKTPAFNDAIIEVLRIIGEATEVSRIYIFENEQEENNELFMSQRFEWTLSGVTAQINNTELQHLSYDVNFTRWAKELPKGEIIHGLVSDFPTSEQAILEPQNILSIAVVPIFTVENWWGFIGFDDCLSNRVWSTAELEELKSIAGVIGSKLERIIAENVLMESEKRHKSLYSMLRMMADNVPDLIWSKDMKNRYTFVNKTICDILLNARDTEEPIGKTDMFFVERERKIHPENPQWHTFGEICMDSDTVVMDSKETQRFEEYGNVNGKFLYLDVYKAPFWDEKGNMIGTVGSGRIVTKEKQLDQERKLAEKELRESQRTLSTLLSNLPGMAYRCLNDENRTMKFVSEGSFELTGYNPLELIDNKKISYGKLIHTDDQKYIWEKVQKALKYFSPFLLEYRIIASSGNEKWVWEHGRGIFSKENKLEALEGFIIDITDRKKADEELLKLQKLESIGTLAGGIAHDFNNILLGLFGSISLAKTELSKDHPAFKFIEKAENAMSIATGLTRQLLTFAKGGEPITENISLNKIVRDITDFNLSGSNVMPVFDLANDLWIAKVDKGQVQQVLSNIIINSNQAMPDGGYLYIKLENADITNNAVPNLDPGKYIKVTIRDEGTGIDHSYIDRIFDPYFSTKQTGSGLGLTTVYSIVTKHRGHINVYSELSKGTTFTLYLPASESQQLPEIKQPGAELSTLGHKVKILLMDDEEIIRDISTEMLKKCGVTADFAIDGKEVIEKYISADKSGYPFDIVILDLTIPGGMGGKETIKELLIINSKVKVIASSGYSTDPIIANYSKYGFIGRLIKPYTMDDLKTELIRVMEI